MEKGALTSQENSIMNTCQENILINMDFTFARRRG